MPNSPLTKNSRNRKIMKQTSVEWLVNVVQSCIAPNFIPKEIVKQAKEMHRQENEDSFVAGSERGTNDIPFNCEQYYTQTFGKKTN